LTADITSFSIDTFGQPAPIQAMGRAHHHKEVVMMSSASSVAVVLALASTLGLSSAAWAAHPPTSPLPEAARPHLTPSGAVAHTVKSLYETWNQGISATLPAGTFTALDALTSVKCAPVAGCTIIAQTNAQVAATVDNTQWAICTQVDGHFANNSCYYQGNTTLAEGYKKGNDRENWKVPTGIHTVQTFIYPTAPMSLSAYQNDYMVVAP
jgi:hypothetical protein